MEEDLKKWNMTPKNKKWTTSSTILKKSTSIGCDIIAHYKKTSLIDIR
jgi:hypothetical protein